MITHNINARQVTGDSGLVIVDADGNTCFARTAYVVNLSDLTDFEAVDLTVRPATVGWKLALEHGKTLYLDADEDRPYDPYTEDRNFEPGVL